MDKEQFKENRKLKIQVITLSDRASKGEYSDLSGPEIVNSLNDYFTEKQWRFEIEANIIPDDATLLEDKLLEAKRNKLDILFTTGGTGIGPRDFTPEVMKKMLDKEIPGIMELIRVKYGMDIPNALLSRGIAGIIGKMQVYTLPGNPKAIKEYCDEIFKTLDHAFLMIAGIDAH